MVSSELVDTVRLDDVDIGPVDFIKLDIQGGELDVLANARKTLKDTLVIDCEVFFIPIYRGQPLFSEVELELRSQGFVFHRFRNIFSRQFKPLVINGNPFAGGSQQLWAEAAIFVRDFTRLESWSEHALLKAALLLDSLYGSIDLAARMLQKLDERKEGCHYLQEYIQALNTSSTN